MADESDVASSIIEESINRAVQNIRDQVSENLESEYFCVDCDNEIPEQRRQAIKGVIRCVHCQDKFDKKSKHYR